MVVKLAWKIWFRTFVPTVESHVEQIRLTENCLRTDQRRFFMVEVVVVEN
jgi:hypothetical protein